MKRDPWVVLGVSRAAGPADWKKAYRRLAMRWHPDRNPDPQATERFKEINAAYEALLAVDAPEMPETEAPPAAETATETTEAAPQAADIRLNLELTLAEAAHGCRKTVRYHRGKPCGTCAGSGEARMARTRFCDACHGSGRVRDAARVLVKCPDCQGRGLFTERICPDCHGSGREHAEAVLEIAVPPGMLAGDDLRLAGQGEPGDGELLPGDLYLTVILRTHPLFELRGRDLCFSMPVSALALLSGEEIELPTLDGRFRHRLTPGGIGESTLRLPGHGYPGRGRQPAGDLVVNLLPVFPRALDEGERKALSRVHALLMANAETCLPAVAEWQRRLRDENL